MSYGRHWGVGRCAMILYKVFEGLRGFSLGYGFPDLHSLDRMPTAKQSIVPHVALARELGPAARCTHAQQYDRGTFYV